MKYLYLFLFSLLGQSLYAQQDLVVHYQTHPDDYLRIKVKGTTALVERYVKAKEEQEANTTYKTYEQNWNVFYDNSKEIRREIRDGGNINILVEYPPEKRNWEFVEGQKEILGYQCQKAILSTKDFVLLDRHKTHQRTQQVEVWFTPEIPVGIGPKTILKGLPGLILEIKITEKSSYSDNLSTYTSRAIKIEKQDLPDLRPTEGVWASPEELEKVINLSEKKLKAWYKEKQK